MTGGGRGLVAAAPVTTVTLLSCKEGPESFNIDMYLVPVHSSSVLSIFNLSLFADIQLSMSVMQRSSLGVVAAISSGRQ